MSEFERYGKYERTGQIQRRFSIKRFSITCDLLLARFLSNFKYDTNAQKKLYIFSSSSCLVFCLVLSSSIKCKLLPPLQSLKDLLYREQTTVNS